VCCACGWSKILGLGLPPLVYSIKRQDEQCYGGLRETVLNRDGRRCRACPNLEPRKLAVHHRVPGVSKLELMITLCARCNAIVERTHIVLSEMTPLLLILWREKRPDGNEQLYLPLHARSEPVTEQPMLAFETKERSAVPVRLFNGEEAGKPVNRFLVNVMSAGWSVHFIGPDGQTRIGPWLCMTLTME
jgi:hypothetical protein